MSVLKHMNDIDEGIERSLNELDAFNALTGTLKLNPYSLTQRTQKKMVMFSENIGKNSRYVV